MILSAIFAAAAMQPAPSIGTEFQGEWSTTLSQCGDRTTGTVLIDSDRLYFWESQFEPRAQGEQTEANVLHGVWDDLGELSETTISLALSKSQTLHLKTEWFEETYVRCEGSDLLSRYLEGKA